MYLCCSMTLKRVRIIFSVDKEVKNRFKSETAIEGHKMQDLLEGFVLSYLVKKEKKKEEVN